MRSEARVGAWKCAECLSFREFGGLGLCCILRKLERGQSGAKLSLSKFEFSQSKLKLSLSKFCLFQRLWNFGPKRRGITANTAGNDGAVARFVGGRDRRNPAYCPAMGRAEK